MKTIPDKTLEHYCALHPIAMRNPDSPIDVTGINPSCIRALYTRGLIEYEFVTINDKSERRILFTKEGLRYGCEALALVPDDNSDNRRREVLRVYLDMGNEDHKTAWDIARSLAGQRILTPTLVDGLLIHSEFLDPDSTYEILEDAYPAIYKKVKSNPDMQVVVQSLSTMVEAMEDRLASILEENKQLRQENERLRQSQPSITPDNRVLQPVSGSTQGNGGLKPLGGLKAIMPPSFDEDDDEGLLEVKKDTQAGLKASQNFIKSMLALQDTPKD